MVWEARQLGNYREKYTLNLPLDRILNIDNINIDDVLELVVSCKAIGINKERNYDTDPNGVDRIYVNFEITPLQLASGMNKKQDLIRFIMITTLIKTSTCLVR